MSTIETIPVLVPKGRALIGTDEYAGLQPIGGVPQPLMASNLLHTRTNVKLSSRGDQLHEIENKLAKYHAAPVLGENATYTERVEEFRRLNALQRDCDDYVKSMHMGDRTNTINELRQHITAQKQFVSGGDVAAYECVADAMDLQEDFFNLTDTIPNAKEREPMVTKLQSKYDTLITELQGVKDQGDPEPDTVPAALNETQKWQLKANAIYANVRKEEFAAMREKWRDDPLMSKIFDEINDVLPSTHLAVGDSPKAGAVGDKIYVQLRLVDTKAGMTIDRRFPQMDTVHELTHAVNTKLFDARGGAISFPIHMLSDADSKEKLKELLTERNSTARNIAKTLYEQYSGKESPGFPYPADVIGKLMSKSSYMYDNDERCENSRAKKLVNRLVESERTGEITQEQINRSEDLIIKDPDKIKQYKALGQYIDANPNKKEGQLNPEAVTNAIVEYDSVINELYFYCKAVGADKPENCGGHPDPLFQLVEAAALDAYNYRQTYREKGLIQVKQPDIQVQKQPDIQVQKQPEEVTSDTPSIPQNAQIEVRTRVDIEELKQEEKVKIAPQLEQHKEMQAPQHDHTSQVSTVIKPQINKDDGLGM